MELVRQQFLKERSLFELQLSLLRPIEIIDSTDRPTILNQIERPFWLLKHQECFQTKSSHVFEETLLALFVNIEYYDT